MSAPELALWWHLYCLEPWGEWRADLRMGILASTTVNLWSAKGHKHATPADFLPTFAPARAHASSQGRRHTAQHMFAVFMQGTQAVGGQIDPRLLTEERPS